MLRIRQQISTCLTIAAFVCVPLITVAETVADSDRRILVTFENPARKADAVPPVPGRYYKYRPRYVVARAAQRSAKALARDYGIRAIDDWPIESLGVFCVVYEASAAADVDALLERLRGDPRVESAQRMHEFRTTATAIAYNDAFVSFQHGLQAMGVAEAHGFATGRGVTIAVVDTGIDSDHEDLAGRPITTWTFLSQDRQARAIARHGTAVVSVIAANPNNGKGIVGVAPDAEVLALGACWSVGDQETGVCNSFTLAKALDFLLRSPPDIVNLSIAGPYDALLERLVARAVKSGVIVVAARSASGERAFPAEFAGVLAVSPAAIDFSADAVPAGVLVAPGRQILVALPNNGYDFRSGSSLAAANASGVIALLLQRAPGLGHDQLAEVLKNSQRMGGTGNPVINACRALAEIGAEPGCH